MKYDIAVVGAGPAGLAAAIQGRQRGKQVVVIGARGDGPLAKTPRLDNYPGLPGIGGGELWQRLREHAREMGALLVQGKVLNILPSEGAFYLGFGSEMVQAESVVLALGVIQRSKFPGEGELLGRGVSYCATCDGMFYRGKEVAVIGLAASAPEEANYLSGIGCKVTYIAPERPEALDASIPFVRGSKVEILGSGQVEGVRVAGELLPCRGAFVLRAAVAPADLLPGLEVREGFLAVDRNMATNLPGVFAAGDCTGLPLQCAKAVGEGQTAGQRAAEYVDDRKKDMERKGDGQWQ